MQELQFKQLLIQHTIKYINLVRDPLELIMTAAQNFNLYYIPTMENSNLVFSETDKETFDKYLETIEKDLVNG